MKTTLTMSLGNDEEQLASQDPSTVNALVLVWSRDEPERLGEVVLLPGGFAGMQVILGRAGPSSDGVLRVELARQRPGSIEPTGPLQSPRVSREQLRFKASANGRMRVENIGRAPLLVNGETTNASDLHVGDRIEIQKQIILLAAHRPLTLPPFAAGTPEPPRFAFGKADTWGLVGESPLCWALREQVAFVAPRAAHVLIRGASGTGKELLAQALHALSPRSRGPMVSRNAATIPETLIDAELFGNARNYPNPGMAERAGLIGEADRGTLFLDEFAEIPPAMQAHLLRVLDHGEYTRLGEARTRKADFRLIAATNRPLSALKEDVAARLRIRVEIPDLNARREDIPLLAYHLLRRVAREDQDLALRYFPDGNPKAAPRISAALMDALLRHRYTTHVRELDHLLWKAMGAGRGDTLELFEDFPVPDATDETTEERDRTPRPEGRDPFSIPPEEIQACLDRHGGRQEPVWMELGLSSRHVLTRLVRRYNLKVRGRTNPGYVPEPGEDPT